MYFTQIEQTDSRLSKFMEDCLKRKYNNNTSIKDIKFNYFQHSTFFAGIQNDCIKTFSGVHNFEFNNELYWRVAFRAVSLYDNTFKPKLSANWRVSSIHMGVGITLEMKWVEEQFGPSKFIITSNDCYNSKDTAGSGHNVDKLFKTNKVDGVQLLYEQITYLNTIQNVWLLDQNVWYDDFEKHYKGKIDIR